MIGNFCSFISIVLGLIISICPLKSQNAVCVNAESSNEFLYGDGTENNPFLISNKYQFDNIRNYTNSYFELVSNIKFLDADFDSDGAFYNNGNFFASIGTDEEPFTGHINGNGFSIDNIHLKSSRGIFTSVSGSKISSLTIKNAVYTGSSSYLCGVFCGEATSATFADCSIYGTAEYTSISQNYATPITGFGTFCGKATSTKFTNCVNGVDITAKISAFAGGFVVHSIKCRYIDCVNNGNISGEYTMGGLAAYDSTTMATTNATRCVNNGSITSTEYSAGSAFSNSKQAYSAGGLFGFKTSGSIIKSYNYGNVSGNYCVGGLVGYYEGGTDHTIQYCVNYGNISGFDTYSYAGGIIGYFTHGASNGNYFRIQYVANHGSIKSSTGYYSNYVYTQGAGGICGYFSGVSSTSITYAYNTGSVLAYHYNCSCYAGGIIGVLPQSKNVSTDETTLNLSYSYSIGHIGDNSLGTDSSHAILGKNNSTLSTSLNKMQYVYALDGCCSNNNLYEGITGGMLSIEQLKNEQSFYTYDFKTKWFIDPFNASYQYPQLVGLDVNNITKVTILDLNEATIETIEGIVPSFENVYLKLENENGETNSIPFRTEYIYSGFNVDNVSLQHIKAKYANIVSENELNVNVVQKDIISIEVYSAPTKTNYFENTEDFDPTGGKIKINYDNATNEIIDFTDCSIVGFDNTSIGTKTITVSYAGFSCNFSVVVYNLSSITISTMPTKTNYVLGQPIVVSTGKLKLNYSDSTSEIINLKDSMCSYDKTATGTVAVIVQYGGRTTSFNINVTEKVVDYYEIFAPSKTVYYTGDELDLTGGYIKITYVSEDNYTVNVSLAEATISGFDSNIPGVKTVNVQYGAISDSFVVVVEEAYRVTFVDYDGTVISIETYHYGDSINVPSNPSRPSDSTYDYTFTGWDKDVSSTCTGNVTYTAQYSSEYIDYTVTFLDDNGNIISTGTYHYGDSVSAPTPTKDPDNTYEYTFAGWDKDVSSTCTGNATYTATFSSTYIEYTVTFVDYDGTVISIETYHYGDSINVPSNPSRPSDSTYDYTFTGWDKDVSSTCTGNVTYTAQYSSEYSEEYLSSILRDELISEIDGVTDIDLSTYSTIVDIQSKMEGLTAADRAIVEQKLNGLIEQYNNFVNGINSEFVASKETFNNLFFKSITAVSGLAYGLAFIMKRRFPLWKLE